MRQTSIFVTDLKGAAVRHRSIISGASKRQANIHSLVRVMLLPVQGGLWASRAETPISEFL